MCPATKFVFPSSTDWTSRKDCHLWWEHVLNGTLSWRNWDLFQGFRAWKPLCVIVILQCRWQWGEMFWLLVNHWMVACGAGPAELQGMLPPPDPTVRDTSLHGLDVPFWTNSDMTVMTAHVREADVSALCKNSRKVVHWHGSRTLLL